MMTIRVQVMAQQAIAQLNALNTALARTGTASRASGAAGAAGAAGFAGQTAAASNFVSRGLGPATRATREFGSTLRNALNPQAASKTQWLGRQLTYNFSIPLAIAGGAAAKWALDTEAAITRVAKVYGDNSPAFILPTVKQTDANGVTKMVSVATAEVNSLSKAFEAMSERFGVAQADVTNIGADWAQAGASGLALAKDVELTLKAMVLGEMDAQEATTALIATQAQYGLTAEELGKALNVMNMAENTSTASMNDLLTVFSKSASVARTAGVGINELAALTATLVPTAGSAANAGNGLKTIFSRLLNPTKQATDLIKSMGINIDSLSYQSQNGEQRLMTLAKGFDGLSSAQKGVVAATLGSVYQINRFDVLMADVIKHNGKYQTTLRATKDDTANLVQANKELQMVLDSNPQKLKQIWVILQNAMINVIQPIIPLIVHLGQAVGGLMKSFSNLDPGLQKFIVMALAFVVVLGPALRILSSLRILLFFIIGPLGALIRLFGFLGTAVEGALALVLAPFRLLFSGIAALVSGISGILARVGTMIVSAFTGGIGGIVGFLRTIALTIGRFFLGIPGLIIAAVVAVVYIFRKSLMGIWNNITEAANQAGTGMNTIAKGMGSLWSNIVGFIIQVFNKLPQGIQNAMMSVISIVRSAAMGVYKLFSYLNPFAHHSPSLVESVTWGMAAIKQQYASVSGVGTMFAKAARDLEQFKQASAGMSDTSQFADQRANIKQVRPRALPAFDAAANDVARLTILQGQYTAAITAQQARVDQWDQAVQASSKAIDAQNAKLDALKGNLDKLQGSYDAAKSRADEFASAPLAGMGAMSDAIFNNDQAVKKLQLQMMDWSDTHKAIADVQTQYANLQGVIENLTARRTELRGKGAGSEILNVLDAQISAARKQQNALGAASNTDPLAKMQAALDKLQNQGDRLNLLNSIKFDPLTRQIDKLANKQKELSFNQVVAGIKANQQTMAALTPEIAKANDAITKQQGAVDAATRAHDALQKGYDTENAKLDVLKTQYDEIGKAISDVSDSLEKMGSSAADAIAKIKAAKDAADSAKAAKLPKAAKEPSLSNAVENFNAGAGANWDDPGGTATDALGREGGMADQSAAIDKFTQDQLSKIGGMFSAADMFKPIKDAWNKTWAWITKNIGGPLATIWNGIKQVFSSFGNIFSGVNFNGALKAAIDPVIKWLTPVWDKVIAVWTTVWSKIEGPIQAVGNFITGLWGSLSNMVVGTGSAMWESIKAGFSGIGKTFSDAWKIIEPTLAPVLAQLKQLGTAILPVLITLAKVFFGALGVAFGLLLAGFSGLVGFLSGALQPAIKLVAGLIAGFVGIIKGALRILTGFFEIIGAIFTLDWIKLGKGLEDVFFGILDVLKAVGLGILNFLKNVAIMLWSAFKGAFLGFANAIGNFAKGLVATVSKAVWGAIDSIGNFIGSIFEGVKAGLKNAWGRFLAWVTGIWQGLVDHFKSFFGIHSPSTVFAELGGWLIRGLWEGIKALGSLLLNVGSWILQHIWDGITSVAKNVWAWFSGIGTHIKSLIEGLGSSFASTGWNIFNWIWNGIKNVAKSVWSWFSGIGTHVWNLVKALGASFTKTGWSLLNWIWDGIKNVAKSVWSWFSGVGTHVWTLIKGMSASFTKTGWSLLNWIWDGIKNVAKNVWAWFTGIGNYIWSLIKALASSFTSTGWSLLNWIWDGIKNVAKSVWSWFTGIGNHIWTLMVSIASSFVSTGWNILNWIWNGVKNVADSVWGWFTGIGAHIWSLIKNIAQTFINSGAAIIGWIWDGGDGKGGIVGGATKLFDWFTNLGDTIWTSITSWIGDAVTWGENIVKGIVKGIGNLASQVWDAIKNLFTGSDGTDGSSLTGGGPLVPFPTPGKAHGGRITGMGGGTADKVPILASAGEFMVRERQTRKHRNLLEAINQDRLPARYELPRFATGGVVDPFSKLNANATSIGTFFGEGYDKAVISNPMAYIKDPSMSSITGPLFAQAGAATLGAVNFGSNDPSSFGWSVGQNIVPFSFQGEPFPAGVASGTESTWTAMLSELVKIIPGGIHPGWNWGYENRDNVNSPGTKSFHSYGLALDVNAPVNPNMPGRHGAAGSGQWQIPEAADAIAKKYGMLWGGEWGDAMHFELHKTKGGIGGAVNGAVGAVQSAIGSVLGNTTGTGVGRWTSLFIECLQAFGQYTDANLQAGLHQMDTESSGNPNAINNWDSNAQKGTPSKGLMQVIDPTFKAYAQYPYSANIWDPASNIRASIAYTLDTYGSLLDGWRGVGYKDGGVVGGTGTSRSDSNLIMASKGELIFPVDKYQKNKALLDSIFRGDVDSDKTAVPGRRSSAPISSLSSGSGDGGSRTIHVHQVVLPGITTEADAGRFFDAIHMLAESR